MIDLAVAAILVRERTEEQFESTPPRRPGGASPGRPDSAAQIPPQGGFRRVASLLVPRNTEGTWPRSRSRTSAC